MGGRNGVSKKSGSENRRRCDPLLHLRLSQSRLIVFACRRAAIQWPAQHALGELLRKALSHLLEFVFSRLQLRFYPGAHLFERLPRLGLRRFHKLRGFGFGLTALGLAPRDCALSNLGEPRLAFLFSRARLPYQFLGAIVQLLELALALRQQVQEWAKK